MKRIFVATKTGGIGAIAAGVNLDRAIMATMDHIDRDRYRELYRVTAQRFDNWAFIKVEPDPNKAARTALAGYEVTIAPVTVAGA